MPKSQVERNKRYQNNLRTLADAGIRLFAIFANHAKDFERFLAPNEQKIIDSIRKMILEDKKSQRNRLYFSTFLIYLQNPPQ